MELAVNISDEALALHRGDIVVVRPKDARFSGEAAARVRDVLKPLEEKHGISFLVVDSSIDLTVMRPVDAIKGSSTHA
jgi:hypothetical protein